MKDQQSTVQKPGLPRAEAARDLRQRSTIAETVLWKAFRSRQLAGLKFRRQRPFGPFVVDFICIEVRLVVEVNGPIHAEQVEQDAYRTEYVTSYGFRVMRVSNDKVTTNLDAVLDKIKIAAQER